MDLAPAIYLTGAPATGKSTVARSLASTAAARVFSYGAALAEHPDLAGLSHDDLRMQSSKVISRGLIADLDDRLPALMDEWRRESAVVIDSHAVTSEVWGLRAIPYDADGLSRLGLTHIVCLVADAGTLGARINAQAEGRRVEDPWKLDQINNAQVALAMAYAQSLGCVAHIVDARPPADQVAAVVASMCGL